MHHCVRSVSFGSRVLFILILFYTLPLLETLAADINDSRECLGLTSKCITSTNFQIFEEIRPCTAAIFMNPVYGVWVDVYVNLHRFDSILHHSYCSVE